MHRFSDLVVRTLCQEMKNHLTQKVGFEGTLKDWTRIGSHIQFVAYKVHMEWKLELSQ